MFKQTMMSAAHKLRCNNCGISDEWIGVFMLADILTKPLGKEKHWFFMEIFIFGFYLDLIFSFIYEFPFEFNELDKLLGIDEECCCYLIFGC